MSFTIPINTSVDTMYQKMKDAVLKAEGDFDGTEKEGLFSIPIALGRISGAYTMSDKGIEVAITKKPFFLSTKMIKDELGKYLE